MGSLYLNEKGIVFEVTQRLEGIYNRECDLIGFEMLSSVKVHNYEKFNSEVFFDLISKGNALLIIQLQIKKIKEIREKQMGVIGFITINVNELMLEILNANTFLLRELSDVSDFAIIEVSEKVDADKYSNHLENISKKCRIWLDDFGCGFFSNKINNLSLFECIKFDRYLINTFLNIPKGQEMLMTLTDDFHKKNIKVIAEGVESSDYLSVLLHCGFDAFQGWYWNSSEC
ncbi:TPA: EAL domain-containing protein [Kluyvera cryocrescens]|nr:EAL domain-containing protein [Kluyvera cryocrescens]